VLYVYAFVSAPASVPDVSGLDGSTLGARHLGALDAVVSEHDGPVDASEMAVLEHARVVEAVAEANDGVLPVRFGGMHDDEAALSAAVAGRGGLAEALGRVRGCVELGLRVLGGAGLPAAASTGAEYMRARLERRHELDRLADELHAPLAALARDSTLAVGTTPRLLLTASYLVPRAEVETFGETVAILQAAHPELGIVCTGPWPPYSFALAEEGRA
jgi:hypothetical protein